VEDDNSDDSDKDDETTAATQYGEDDESDDEYGTSTRDGELVDENQYDSEADLFDNFSSSSSSLDVIEKHRFNDGMNGIADVANKAVLSLRLRNIFKINSRNKSDENIAKNSSAGKRSENATLESLRSLQNRFVVDTSYFRRNISRQGFRLAKSPSRRMD